MTHREFVMQRLYDNLTVEQEQEAAMDRKLLADNARLAGRLRKGA